MNVHLLKIKPMYYKPLVNGEKRCEVRYNDRGYQVGDLLVLWLFDGGFKNEFSICRITHIIDDPSFCKEGYVILSISVINDYNI